MRIEVSEEDAASFACNAVAVGRRIFMNSASAHLQERLRAGGFLPILTPLSEFLKAGGAAKCLTLELTHPVNRKR
jgi:N-dimethylarginine dimethylaminohydrolase